MKPIVLFACLVTVALAGCSWLPSAGPTAGEVVGQAQTRGEILFDVVDVDNRVVSTLLSQPKESFRARFGKDAGPPDVKIAVGDTVSVVIWESAAGGLFSPPLPTAPAPGTEPLVPESATEAAALYPRPPATIPEQAVGADGGISVPYAGRIPVAGRSPQEVQHTIEARLADKALEPQALVYVTKSPANSVPVSGEMVPRGTMVPLSVGGDRLLQVIAAAGGISGTPTPSGAPGGTGGTTPSAAAGGTSTPPVAVLPYGAQFLSPSLGPPPAAATGGVEVPPNTSKVHETFVRLTRGGATATLPLARLIADPSEDIYARPGDVLTLVRVPQTFSVFGATGRNAEITFEAEKITLSEALAKSRGLDDNLANPKGVFLFRYEPNSTVRALDQPVASHSQDGSSPIAYRFDFKDANSYLLAQEFPMRDKDIIFVADAGAVQVQKIFAMLATITGPVITGLVACSGGRC
ncbi:MAG: polysaccharide export protein [Alphaproteobacteria bacterium]|nr:polysaccharide export protein [Alphaproteobacteria bacterium]